MKRFARFLPSLRTRLALGIALVAAGCAHRPAAEEPPDPVAELCRVLSEREGYPMPVGLVLMRAKTEDTSPDEYARSGLRELGVGANIQHYNPVIDEAVRTLFGLPENYVLVAQMPFGGIVTPPAPKADEDISLRVRVAR